MQYEKHKIILPQFEDYDELLDYVYDDIAIYHYQGGEWDKIKMVDKERPTLKEPPTLTEFLSTFKHHFPNGVRIGDEYTDKYGNKIDKNDT